MTDPGDMPAGVEEMTQKKRNPTSSPEEFGRFVGDLLRSSQRTKKRKKDQKKRKKAQ